MMTNFDKPIISNYSPITSKGGKRKSRKHRTRRHKKSNKSRTRRRH